MAQQPTLEQRVDELEEQVRLLSSAVFQSTKKPGWLGKIVGSMKDDPEFAEILKLGREIRQADRPN